MYELIIIGAGPAGITASIYAARKRMNFLVITEDIGGQTALTSDIENYTGYQFITGIELTSKFEEHIKQYGIPINVNESVKQLWKENDIISVKTDKGVYQSKTAIIASGKKSKKLGVPGEREFKNKGLTYCATCDGPLFSNMDVAVIGGGNSALEAALQLTKIANKIYIINIASGLTGDMIMQEKVKQNNKVAIMNNTAVKEIVGDKMVTGIKVSSERKDEVISCKGVFVEIGLIPNSGFAVGIEKNKQSEIKVNSRNETNIPGIFAAGDVTDISEKQIIVAAGEGAKAALSAFRFLSRKKYQQA